MNRSTSCAPFKGKADLRAAEDSTVHFNGVMLISLNEYDHLLQFKCFILNGAELTHICSFSFFFSSTKYNDSPFLWVVYVILHPRRLKVAHSQAAF